MAAPDAPPGAQSASPSLRLRTRAACKAHHGAKAAPKGAPCSSEQQTGAVPTTARQQGRKRHAPAAVQHEEEDGMQRPCKRRSVRMQGQVPDMDEAPSEPDREPSRSRGRAGGKPKRSRRADGVTAADAAHRATAPVTAEEAAVEDAQRPVPVPKPGAGCGPSRAMEDALRAQIPKPGAGCGPSRAMEDALRAQGYANVAGVDEAGRGPLAGPVVVAACVVPPGVDLPGVDDSKKMSEKQREEVYERIRADDRIKWAVCTIGPDQIDRDNILQATLSGMARAVASLAGRGDPGQQGETAQGPASGLAKRGDQAQQGVETQGAPDAAAGAASGAALATTSSSSDGGGGAAGATCDVHYALVDGNRLPKNLHCPAAAVVKGDSRCVCIAAASILAKVTRDRLMLQYHEQYPQYGFDQHKAYGVPSHMAAIKQHGPCPIHRRSFEPVKSMTGWSRPKARKAGKQAGNA